MHSDVWGSQGTKRRSDVGAWGPNVIRRTSFWVLHWLLTMNGCSVDPRTEACNSGTPEVETRNWCCKGIRIQVSHESFIHWDSEAGCWRMTLVISVAPSPRGELFATGSGDMRARIWRYVGCLSFVLCREEWAADAFLIDTLPIGVEAGSSILRALGPSWGQIARVGASSDAQVIWCVSLWYRQYGKVGPGNHEGGMLTAVPKARRLCQSDASYRVATGKARMWLILEENKEDLRTSLC